MKKYLMTGIAAIAIVAGFTSCTSHDFEPMTQGEIAKAKYEAAFLKYVGGTIDKNQDWGFSETSYTTRTRTANENGNQWEDWGYTIPADITPAELQKVLAVFNQKGAESYTSLVDWDEYFVQQVYKGVAHYTAKNGGDVLGSDHMDKLVAYVPGGVVEEGYFAENNYQFGTRTVYYEHINNFNNGNNTSKMTSEKSGRTFTGITLMMNSSTQSFGFHESESSKEYYYFRMEEIDGNYYVGFDFSAEGQNPNQQVDRDLIYNDWIVKIVPGKPTPTADVRIIGEDLTASDDTDFDFNDIVIDVKYTSDTSADVTLLAAGGTLPLKFFGPGKTVNDTEGVYEVHALFGVDTKTMVNTGGASVSREIPDPVTITGLNKSLRGKDITIMVNKGTEEEPSWVELTASKGEPAAKIAVGPTFGVCSERQSIKKKYPLFAEWVVGNPDFLIWWEN